jgi:hypothetical protein
VAEAACNQADRLAAARDHLPTLKHLVEQACLQLGDVVESFGEELADKAPTNAPEDLKKTNAAWQALADIAPLLAAEDFAALEQFAQSRPIFDALPVAGIEQIEAALQDLDLQAALQAYEAMRPAG